MGKQKLKAQLPLEKMLLSLKGKIQDDIIMDYKFKKSEEEINLKEEYLKRVEDIIDYCNERNRF